MNKHWLAGLLCLAALAAIAWISGVLSGEKADPDAWIEVSPGVYRSPQLPAGHALVDGPNALLIDAPHGPERLKIAGVKKVDAVLLTHHHRDTCAAAASYQAAGVPVRAPKAAADWLTPANVRKFWQEAFPLRNSRTSYFVMPTGLDNVDYALDDGRTIDWHGWTIQVVATPGHARDHLAFLARKGKTGPLVAFCGGALASPGKIWTPYTTDWDHWTDAGLTPAAKSLRKLADVKPDILLPAHGAPITAKTVAVLNETAAAVEEMAFLKSFERFTKERLGQAPPYRFLAREQAMTAGEKPWSRVSEHLFLTGNTYVLTSKDDSAFLVVDPWGQLSADQIVKLRQDQKLGKLEVVMFSHAHFDHYDGIYYLPDRDKLQVWTLDQVALPLADPNLLRAPFLDARPIKFDRRLKDGETASWREYRFLFHHFPGQTEYTMGVETTIEGKRCYFTADNFFHQDMFSGSGGWMGLNRSYPLPYAASAQKVLDAAPDWVLAEHGGPFEFNAEDFRRRVRWGQVSAVAADAISPSGSHRRDWDPNRLHFEPQVQKVKAGATVMARLVAANPLPSAESVAVVLEGRGWLADQQLTLNIPARGLAQREVSLRLDDKTPAGRHVFALRPGDEKNRDGSDSVLVLDVEP